ncbi:uncharacterized protein BXZ73DRAFT_77677 [Epithele typhae]|uniref:uncharacterized protein n=1 Tax=Epithele typhae TaxID=378194 RepID=UPI00200789E4|nr:uncharacterized protein BXZ73DRAFT_77677 [Epithele typhae]KAH9931652.1 hypothetical protein BXZ73DRAFT_77677 [Epithele typhae]
MSLPPRTPMGPPQDVVMGPPPVPGQAPVPLAGKFSKEKDSDVTTKYSRLKRKYFELEEKHKEAMVQLKTSGERNIKWRAERQLLLERISELETNPATNPGVTLPQPPFTAFPRVLLNDKNQKLFVANLRQAIEEIDREDPEIDPHLLSRHIGPAARKRQEIEMRERQEEEAREAAKRPPVRKLRTLPTKGKDIGAPLTYAPAPVHGVLSPLPSAAVTVGYGEGGPSSPTVLSSSGFRLRIKGPAPPAHEGTPPGHPQGPPPSHPGPQSHPSGHLPLPPHTSVHRHSQSMSPDLSPQDEYVSAIQVEGMSPPYQHGAPPSQAQMQMTLRTSSASSRPSDIQRHTKPKRLKAHTVTTRTANIPLIPRDRDGRPILPLTVGIMTVLHLGEVCMREHFHTERYIFPVGYEVTRRYSSTMDPNAEVTYHCKILDGGDGPKFQIIAADAPDKPIVAGTATGAWSVIVRAANHIRNRAHSNSVSGPDFFGLGQNTIKYLIQELPHANQLRDYVWQDFREGGPLGGRHAPVVPALPDDMDPPSPTADSSSNGYMDVVDGEQELHSPTHNPGAGPTQAVLGRHGELQIIEDPSLRGRNGPPPTHSPTAMKPITFHQEYPNAPPSDHGQRGRRGSRASNYDDYPPMHVDSPHSRTASHSPVMHRERERDGHYSPPHQLPPPPPLAHSHSLSRSHGSIPPPSPHHRYVPHANGGDYREHYDRDRGRSPPPPPPPGPAVPATFASIMNAYPNPPPRMGSPPASESSVYANGVRRNGHAAYPPRDER